MTRAELSANLKQAVSSGTPIEVVDSATDEKYYLVSAQQFQQLSSLLLAGVDPRDAYPVIDQVMADDDAKDPWLESYQ
jgi:hypothetical protein